MGNRQKEASIMSQRGFQFQIGLSLIDFTKKFGTEKKCRRHFESQKWPQGFRCRHCNCLEYSLSCRATQQIYHCRKCRKQESLRSGTLPQGNQQPFLKWYWAIQLISQCKNCISALEMHRQLDIPYNTMWNMKHKIMEMMYANDNKAIGHYIEVDESQLEYSPVEQSPDLQYKNILKTAEYRPFIAALETRADGCPVAIKLNPVKNFERDNIQTWLDENVCNCCKTICDTQHCYENFCDICKDNIHMLIITKRESKNSRNWLNIILSNIKASIYGTFHNINFKLYAYRYLADLQYRFNRRFDLKKMFYGLIACAARSSHPGFK